MQRLYPAYPSHLRRSWHFVPGANSCVQLAALSNGSDAVVADLEEQALPSERPAGRRMIVDMLQRARALNVVGAVRINKLENDGYDDLAVVMHGAPTAIFLPHAETQEQMLRLDDMLLQHEAALSLELGSTEIVPNVESALGITQFAAILGASNRIRCAMLAIEDLAASLGARRSPTAWELMHVRGRFLTDCRAAAVVAIDFPCTYKDEGLLLNDLSVSTGLGFTSKSATFSHHIPHINRAMRPTTQEFQDAVETIAKYQAQMSGTPITDDWIDSPTVTTAKLTVRRYNEFEVFETQVGIGSNPA